MEKKQLVNIKTVKIEDAFWNKYTKLVTEQIIPYQWKALNDQVEDAEPSHSIENFKVAAGLQEGTFHGFVCQDTDLAKWLEAVAYSLSYEPNKDLEQKADEAIELIAKAQQEDGYINTFFTILAPEKRWNNLREGHELYTAGHMMEAAVAYYKVTGKKRFVEIMQKFADLICEVFHQEEYKRAVPGHQEIEIGLIKMAEVTGERRYMDMAKEFIDRRGTEPNYLVHEHEKEGWINIFQDRNVFLPEYSQCHKPVREQETAEGHSVRAMYMYCAMADLAAEYDDEELLEACKKLWNNAVQKRMYITGGIGSSGPYERFTVDYDLPNSTNYSESCASIGLALFGRRMAQITGESHYIDVVERALYNTVLAGIAMNGKSFFYVNPLEVWPDNCIDHSGMDHVKPVRQKWFGCACCPPNIARTLASLGEYVYMQKDDRIDVNLFVSNCLTLEDGISIEQKTNYPFDGTVNIKVHGQGEQETTIGIRVPEYVDRIKIVLNGEEQKFPMEKGYGLLKKAWTDDEIQVIFDIPAKIMRANPLVRADAGKVAIQKGPLVYCLEEVDNGKNLSACFLDPKVPLQEEYCENVLGGTTVIGAKGKRLVENWDTSTLYANSENQWEDVELTFVPYGYWGNRGYGEMMVWVKELL